MKKLFLLLTSLSLCLLLTSCGIGSSVIPNMTEEEENMIVEYAAQSLLHYDKTNGNKMGLRPNIYKDIDKEEDKPVIEWVEPQIVQKPEEEEVKEDKASSSNGEGSDASIPEYDNLAQFLGVDDTVAIDYAGYEITDTYPNSLDAYFVMNASSGKKLLVIKYIVRNISDHDINVDFLSKGLKFKIKLNDSSKNALTTMLVNDMAFLQTDISLGEEYVAVIIGEYESSLLSEISTLKISAKCNSQNASFSLQ